MDFKKRRHPTQTEKCMLFDDTLNTVQKKPLSFFLCGKNDKNEIKKQGGGGLSSSSSSSSSLFFLRAKKQREDLSSSREEEEEEEEEVR